MMLEPRKFDAHIKAPNWSLTNVFGKHPLVINSSPFKAGVYQPIMRAYAPVGIKSVTVTTSVDVVGAKLSFALITGSIMGGITPYKVVVDDVIAEVDIAKAVDNSKTTWGTMFTKGTPDVFTLRELQSQFSGFTDKSWDDLYLAAKITGGAVPDDFNMIIKVEGFGETSS